VARDPPSGVEIPGWRELTIRMTGIDVRAHVHHCLHTLGWNPTTME
jgi:hypothetical protein